MSKWGNGYIKSNEWYVYSGSAPTSIPNISDWLAKPKFIGFEIIVAYGTYRFFGKAIRIGNEATTVFCHDGTRDIDYYWSINWNTGAINSNLSNSIRAFKPIFGILKDLS